MYIYIDTGDLIRHRESSPLSTLLFFFWESQRPTVTPPPPCLPCTRRRQQRRAPEHKARAKSRPRVGRVVHVITTLYPISLWVPSLPHHRTGVVVLSISSPVRLRLKLRRQDHLIMLQCCRLLLPLCLLPLLISAFVNPSFGATSSFLDDGRRCTLRYVCMCGCSCLSRKTRSLSLSPL